MAARTLAELSAGLAARKYSATELTREALEWATTRGARSGRVAWQFVQDIAGRLGVRLQEKRKN